jgi:hypothetical protein
LFTKNIYYDKFAIGLSLLCTLHCLALPLLILLLPAVSAVFLADEGFHFYMVMMVLPISCFSLCVGFKQHQESKILLQGVTGLIILSITVLLGHEQLGEITEKLLTLLGSSFICYSHYLNYKICQTEDNCCC